MEREGGKGGREREIDSERRRDWKSKRGMDEDRREREKRWEME